MEILVFVKRVPDTESKIRINPETNSVVEEGLNFILSPYDEYAMEEALRIKQRIGGEVAVLTAGPERVSKLLRNALALGADRAFHILAPSTRIQDPSVLSWLMAQTIHRRSST